MRDSLIRDISLAPDGERKLDWARRFMPILQHIEKDFQASRPLRDWPLLLCLHLEAKTGLLALALQAAGADVTIVASNPLSTQDDVVAALVKKGIRAFAWHGATMDEYFHHIRRGLDYRPRIIVDDGADVICLLHRDFPELLPNIQGACEETTTGVSRIRALAQEKRLAFPVIAVNDALMKYLFDNRYGTGQSVWDGIIRSTNLLIAGKKVVVAGYGWCGKGVAKRAQALGAQVIVTEIDPVKACEAVMDGYAVMEMTEAAAAGDFFITVTGNIDVIRKEHLERMKDGAVLANAGHFDVEISKHDLLALASSVRLVRPHVEEYQLADSRKIYLLAEGRLVNLAAADGHPIEVMDTSFALQALSVRHIAENVKQAPGIYPVPEALDYAVAGLRLKTWDVSIDALNETQKHYLQSWNE